MKLCQWPHWGQTAKGSDQHGFSVDDQQSVAANLEKSVPNYKILQRGNSGCLSKESATMGSGMVSVLHGETIEQKLKVGWWTICNPADVLNWLVACRSDFLKITE